MLYTLGGYEENLYTENIGYMDSLEDILRHAGRKDIGGYRLRSTFSGDILESDAYPVWKTAKTTAKEIAKELKASSRPEQVALNHRNKRKNIVRLMNANFTENDIWITLGYRNGKLPADFERAQKDIRNYIAKLKRHAKKLGFEDLKYLYVIELPKNEYRWHHHLVTNFPDRDLAEKLWKGGEYPQSRRLQPSDYGLEGLADYLSKDIIGKKTYGYSLGLKKPWLYAKIANHKISRQKAEKIAYKEIDIVKFYEEQLYPGYKLLEVEYKKSTYVAGVYLYAKLRKLTEKEQKAKDKEQLKYLATVFGFVATCEDRKITVSRKTKIASKGYVS